MKLFELWAELGLDASGFNSGVNSATKKGNTLANSLKSGLGGAANAVGGGVKATTIMMGNLMASAVKKGAAFIKEVAATGIEYNSTMETYVTNFATMLGGSSDAAQKLTGDLEDMAAATPFAMADLAGATQTLLSFGQDSGTVLGTLQNLGDIAMGDANRLSSLTLAFAQASSSGKLMGQDLMQMINAGFNPLQSIIDRTGASMGDLKDFMSNGKASAALKKQMKAAQKEVKQFGDQASDGSKLLAQMAEDGAISAETLGMIFDMETSPGGRYHDAMKNASQTFEGMLSTLQDDSAALLGRVFKPMSDYIKSDLMPKAQGFIANVNKGFDLGGIKGAWSAAIGTISGYLDEMSGKALAAGSDLLANVLTGLTGDTVSGSEISAFISGVWSDAQSGLDGLLSAGGGLLKGIYDGLISDGDSKTSIVAEISGIWNDASASIQGLIDSAGGLLGTIYTQITGQEATAENIGKTIGGVFDAGGTAIQNLMSTASTFFSDLDEKLGEPDASVGQKIAGVFLAGQDAMVSLLNDAGTFMTQLYEAVTGDTAGAAKMQGWIDGIFKTSKQVEEENAAAKAASTTPYAVKYDQTTHQAMLNAASSMYSNPSMYGITEAQADAWVTQLSMGNLGMNEYKQIADEIGAALQYAKTLEQETKKELESEKESGLLDDLGSVIASLNAAVAEMPGQAGSAAASALSGAQVMMDGAAVGALLLPTISAGLARQFKQASVATP